MKSLIKLLTLFSILGESLASAPKIFSHRGGGEEFPENTLYAFEASLEGGVHGIELDVQLTKDGRVVAYHPRDLAQNTNGKGPIGQHTYEEIRKLDAAFNFDPLKNHSFPERGKNHYIPLLEEVLKYFPFTYLIIDFKSLPVEPLVEAVIKIINEVKAWNKILFYSTNSFHLTYLLNKVPNAKVFEHRHITLKRLLTLRNSGVCSSPNPLASYIGFELMRDLKVIDMIELGKESYKVSFKLWDEKALECVKKATRKGVQIFLFGINNKHQYEEAKRLEVEAVITDCPLKLLRPLPKRGHHLKNLERHQSSCRY